MIRIRSQPAILLFFASVGTAALARADCAQDTDCKGDRVCEVGQCVAPKPKACSKDTDCAGNQVCGQDYICADPAVRIVMPAALPPPSKVAVNVGGLTGHFVTIDGASCASPCTLQVEPGNHTLSTPGFPSVKVPVGNSSVQVSLERSYGVAWLGAVSMALGSAALGIGTLIPESCDEFGNCTNTAQLATWVAGGSLEGIGLLCLVIGLASPERHVEINGSQAEVANLKLDVPHVRPWFSTVGKGSVAGFAVTF